MAKYQFAEQARKTLEENGVVINDDGTTGFAKQPEQFVVGDEAKPAEAPVQEVPPAQVEEPAKPNAEETPAEKDERDRLIEMQRQELEELRAKANQAPAQTQSAKSERETELETELAALRAQLAEKETAQSADEFRAMLEAQGFDSDNLDDDVLLEVRERLIAPTAKKLTALEQRLSKAEERFREPTPAERLEQTKQKVYGEIKKEIPDFDTIFNSKEFKEKLTASDDRFPTATYGHALQEALENGRSDFIIREIKSFMGGKKDPLSAIADVSGSNGAGKATEAKAEESGFTFTDEEARKMLRAFQMRDISRQEYSEYRSKLDAHRLGK
jgi:cysteinyl-tRNA synthetase